MWLIFIIASVIAIILFFLYDFSVSREIRALKRTIDSQQKEILSLKKHLKNM